MAGNDHEAEALLTEMLKKDPSGNAALYLLADCAAGRNLPAGHQSAS